MTSRPTIRPIAIGIFRRADDEILVGFANDVVKQERYCRPPGGAIEFGERASEALRREMLEETRELIAAPRLLGVLENTFALEGVPKHEIIFVFEAAFADPCVHERGEVALHEAGWEGALQWVSLSECRNGSIALYPDGLLALLDGAADVRHRMTPRTLKLQPHDPEWPRQYQAESVRILGAVRGIVLQIEHVGSTAVSALIAKPVIDIAMTVASEPDADRCIDPMRGLGYEYRGLHGEDPRRRYYVRDTDGRRTSHVHLYILPAPAWDEMLAFRDALRKDAQLAAEYAAEKVRVAELVGWNKADYSEAKGPFVQRVLAQLQRGAR